MRRRRFMRAGGRRTLLIATVLGLALSPAAAALPGTGNVPGAGQRTDIESYRMARSLAIRGQAEDALELLGGELGRGFDSAVVLADVAWSTLRRDPRFKGLIREFASQQPTALATTDEPGIRMTLNVEVLSSDGTPLAGALVYAYQADAEGLYSLPPVEASLSNDPVTPRDSSVPGDSDNPRLWAYTRSDPSGRVSLQTIRPGPYPTGGVPAHVHLEVEADGFDRGVFEVLFDDDPLLDEAGRGQSRQLGWPVVQLAGSPLVGEARLRLPGQP